MLLLAGVASIKRTHDYFDVTCYLSSARKDQASLERKSDAASRLLAARLLDRDRNPRLRDGRSDRKERDRIGIQNSRFGMSRRLRRSCSGDCDEVVRPRIRCMCDPYRNVRDDKLSPVSLGRMEETLQRD